MFYYGKIPQLPTDVSKGSGECWGGVLSLPNVVIGKDENDRIHSSDRRASRAGTNAYKIRKYVANRTHLERDLLESRLYVLERSPSTGP